MGKLIRLGATALSMIGILVMILCVQQLQIRVFDHNIFLI